MTTNIRSPLVRILPSLTPLRAIAALAVFTYHLRLWQSSELWEPIRFGFTGVTVFFVLSGFILTWTHRPQSCREFYLRRFARVYPMYFVLVVAVAFWFFVRNNPRDPGALWANLLLVQAWSVDGETVFSINSASWSLSAEIFFYALFPLLWVWSRRFSIPALWTLVGAAVGIYGTVIVVDLNLGLFWHYGTYTNPLGRLPEFAAGIALARTMQAGRRIPGWAWAPVALFAAAGVVAADPSGTVWMTPVANVWVTPLAVVMIGRLAQRDLAGKSGVWAWPPLQFAGRLSYSFYLVHCLVWASVAHTIEDALSRAGIIFALSVVAALGLHLLVEVPANRWIVRWYMGRQGFAAGASVREETTAKP